MRGAFVSALSHACESRDDIVLLTGDLGFGVLNDFRARFPSQFMNLGVAEQNLAGVGAGLALSGHTVVTYSIGNFPTLRCLEQIRNDICYHEADVKIVTVGGGLAYGALGPSHFATEDLGILRTLPAMTVVAPGDPGEVELLVPQIFADPGPVYLRLGRAGEDRITPADADVRLGKAHVLHEAGDVILMTTGGMLPVGLEARRLLAERGIEAGIASLHTLKPLDSDWIRKQARRVRLAVTVEEHSILGGLGGAVAEVLAESSGAAPLLRVGLASEFPRAVGSQHHLRSVLGLDAPALADRVASRLGSLS